MYFYGYPRENGTYGTRNHVLVMSSVVCANSVVNTIARQVPGALAITHDHGCAGTSEIAMRVLPRIGANANFSAVLVVGLGCEWSSADEIARQIRGSGKTAHSLVIQKEGGSLKTARKGASILEEMLAAAAKETRVKAGLEHLKIGVKCSGTDMFSGVTANPSVGQAVDRLVGKGCLVIVSELPETGGAASAIKRRALNPDVARKIDAYIKLGMEANKWYARRFKQGLRYKARADVPSYLGEGYSNVCEKSLSYTAKWGSTPVNDCIPYAAASQAKGLVIMETDNYNLESMAGIAAGGAQVMIFSTGKGGTSGFTGVPVIKVVSNSATYQAMEDDLDINAGAVADGKATISDLGKQITDMVIAVASGEETKAEINKQGWFAIRQEGYSYPSLHEIQIKCL